jgi:hypothetical protein
VSLPADPRAEARAPETACGSGAEIEHWEYAGPARVGLAADTHRPLGFSVRRFVGHGSALQGAQFGATTVTVTVRVMPLAVSVAVIV